MTIYSWNMLFRNKEQERAFAFIRDTAWDVFCLQEVPKEFLARLKELPVEVTVATDVERVDVGGQIHLVILSNYPIKGSGIIPLPDYQDSLPLRTRIFVKMMRPFSFSKIRDRNALYADIALPGFTELVRIFNLHLILGRPDWRAAEFEKSMIERRHGQPTVVCGDFNIIESPHMTPLNWFVAGDIGDVVFWNRERERIEERFVAHELENLLRGKMTHPFSRSQLDHILVSKSIRVGGGGVVGDAYGSDHRPIYASVQ